MNIVKYCCILCENTFTTNNFEAHHRGCAKHGKSFAKIHSTSLTCKFCERLFLTANGRGVHEVSCSKNPEPRDLTYVNGRKAWNRGLTKDTDGRVLKNTEGIKNAIKNIPTFGKCKNPSDEVERCLKISKTSKINGNNGGYRANAGRSKKFKVFDSFGNLTTLQSTFEYACFEILCELGIRWIRPTALKYDNRNYFSDFYLIDFDVYLDPKNDYKAKQDEEKISKVVEQNDVKVFVLLQHQITKDFISRVI